MKIQYTWKCISLFFVSQYYYLNTIIEVFWYGSIFIMETNIQALFFLRVTVSCFPLWTNLLFSISRTATSKGLGPCSGVGMWSLILSPAFIFIFICAVLGKNIRVLSNKNHRTWLKIFWFSFVLKKFSATQIYELSISLLPSVLFCLLLFCDTAHLWSLLFILQLRICIIYFIWFLFPLILVVSVCTEDYDCR